MIRVVQYLAPLWSTTQCAPMLCMREALSPACALPFKCFRDSSCKGSYYITTLCMHAVVVVQHSAGRCRGSFRDFMPCSYTPCRPCGCTFCCSHGTSSSLSSSLLSSSLSSSFPSSLLSSSFPSSSLISLFCLLCYPLCFNCMWPHAPISKLTNHQCPCDALHVPSQRIGFLKRMGVG
jgi:hypothetical protein